MLINFVENKEDLPKKTRYIGKAKPYGKLKTFVEFIRNSIKDDRSCVRIYFVINDFSIYLVNVKKKVLKEVISLTIFEPEDKVISIVKFIQQVIKERNISLERIRFDCEEFSLLELI